MTLKESYEALGLKNGADLSEIKRTYRRLAFALHPDLNPDVPDAAKRFQRINEAYVILSQNAARQAPHGSPQSDSDEAGARARDEAYKAYAKAGKAQQENAKGTGDRKESVLNDILNDPFARRVFEDIYSHIREEGSRQASQKDASPGNTGKSTATPVSSHSGAQKEQRPKAAQRTGVKNDAGSGVVGKVQGWLRKQIDDEQVLRLPGESLVPGARVRLEIQHGFSGEPQVVELTLPPEFKPGKAMRLKGMGKRVGNWKGDLYVRIEPI